MSSYRRILLGTALTLLAVSSAHAQCPNPTTGQLRLVDRAGNPHPMGAHHICLGSLEYLGGTVLAARDADGARATWFLANVGGSELQQDSYLCLSFYDDTVTIADGNDTADCTDSGLLPFAYGGHALTLYMLDGNDHLHGGLGREIAYGNEGNDDLWGGYGGDDEQLHGGSGNDALWGSSGANTLLNGGGEEDELHDEGGDGTSFLGGPGRDVIDNGKCEAFRVIDCGDGPDTVILARLGPDPITQNCELFDHSGEADFCE